MNSNEAQVILFNYCAYTFVKKMYFVAMLDYNINTSIIFE